MKNRFLECPQTHITVNGQEYPLNTDYKSALEARKTLRMAHFGEIEYLAASYDVIYCMLGIYSMDNNMSMQEINEAVKGITEYLFKYAKTHDSETKDNKPPILDLEYDWLMIIDAFQRMNIDLYAQTLSYPRFMSLLRELPDDCRLCRIMYLRQLVQDGKINKKEYKSERAECTKIGWDIINMTGAQEQEEIEDSEECNEFWNLFNGS